MNAAPGASAVAARATEVAGYGCPACAQIATPHPASSATADIAYRTDHIRGRLFPVLNFPTTARRRVTPLRDNSRRIASKSGNGFGPCFGPGLTGYRRASTSRSFMSVGHGHCSPADDNRSHVNCTVELATPIDAISEYVRPASKRSRASSFNFRMDNRSCAIVDSSSQGDDLKGYPFNFYRLMPESRTDIDRIRQPYSTAVFNLEPVKPQQLGSSLPACV